MYTAKALLSFALLLSVSGCATSQGGSRLPQQAPNLVASPNTLNFGNKAVGSTSTLTVTLTNSGNVTATVSQISVTGGAGFSTSLTPPLALTAGQSSTFTVRFSPQTAGGATGSLSLVSNAVNSPTTVTLSGTGVQPQLTVTPSAVNFPNVLVGTKSTQTITLSNPGTVSVTISRAAVSGTGFSLAAC